MDDSAAAKFHQSLSVRTYRPIEQSHSHHYDQVVVPLEGQLDISLAGTTGPVSVGQGVVIKRHIQHTFSAGRDARFLVADLHELPKSANSLINPVTTLSCALKSFCDFVEILHETSEDSELQYGMIIIFKHLLSEQASQPSIDRRILKALTYLESDVSQDYTLAKIASWVSLSVSQFKVVFARDMGMSAEKYLQKLRMEKARTLLSTTNMPISIIAESTGYKDQSAFSRRFRLYYGVPPSRYRKQ